MGILDKVGDVAGDIAIKLVAEKLGELASYLLTAAFGDKADDSAKQKLARALAESGAAALEALAKEKLAAKELPAKFREVLGAIAAIDVEKLFRSGVVEAGPMEVKFTCQLTLESWDKLIKHTGWPSYEADAPMQHPSVDDVVTFSAVGVYNGTLITLSDADRRVPLDIARILEA